MSDQPPKLAPIVPHFGQRKTFTPKVGGRVIVDVPGERLLCFVEGIVNADSIVVRIDTVPVGKAPHGYQKGDIVPARRSEDVLGQEERWAVVSDREMRQAEDIAKFKEEEIRKAKEAEEARIAAQRAHDLGPDGEAERKTQADMDWLLEQYAKE